jgi:peroxiredoxin
MAATESEMLELGTIAPEFSLPDPDGKLHALGENKNAYLVMFICNHCPFVKHVREELARLGRDFLPKDVSILAINSNDATTHSGDSPEKMKAEAETWGYQFPYLIDADQGIAKAYRAACTPDFFLFNANKQLVYRGQLDDSRPSNNIPVTGTDLRAAIESVLGGRKVFTEQKPSIGCNIKWLPGNQPDYFQ